MEREIGRSGFGVHVLTSGPRLLLLFVVSFCSETRFFFFFFFQSTLWRPCKTSGRWSRLAVPTWRTAPSSSTSPSPATIHPTSAMSLYQVVPALVAFRWGRTQNKINLKFKAPETWESDPVGKYWNALCSSQDQLFQTNWCLFYGLFSWCTKDV